MSARRYPAACLAFTVENTDGRIVPNGTIVEFIGVQERAFRSDTGAARLETWTAFSDGSPIIGVRVIDHATPGWTRHPTGGWIGLGLHPNTLRPLTPDARAILAAIVEGK